MRLIGLHARLHAGKDTAFATIEKTAADENLLALRRAFADPLKVSGMRALGCNHDYPSSADEVEELVGLANKIKETGQIIFTYDDVSPVTGNLIPKSHVITGRQFWQFYGTEAHRADDLGHSFGQNFWVDNLLPQGTDSVVDLDNEYVDRPRFWESFKEGWAGYADIAVVTDVRFPNEAERILSLGGEIHWIDADERLGPNTDEHASEAKLPDDLITHRIDNNGTLAQFQNNVIEALNN